MPGRRDSSGGTRARLLGLVVQRSARGVLADRLALFIPAALVF
jgi:hypothetical protein